MKIALRSDRSKTKTAVVLTVFTILLLALSVYFGELVMPFLMASFALLLFFDGEKYIASAVSVAIGIILLLLPLQQPSIWGIATLLLGAILHLTYRFGFSKCDSAILLTVVTTGCIFFYFFLLAFDAIGDWNFGAAVDFYSELKNSVRSEFVSGVMATYSTLPEAAEMGITSEYVASLFDSFVNMLVSVIAVISFFIIGIAMKVFCAIGRRLAEENDGINSWRFEPSTVYAYFYIALYVVSMFIAPDSVLGITLANVVSILSFVFAYMGVKYAYGFFAERGKKGLGKIVIALSVLIFSSMALNLLSVLGAAYTVYRRANRSDSQKNDPTN